MTDRSRSPAAPRVVALVALLALRSLPAAAQQDPTLTPTVFHRFADRVVKVQVVESGSGAKAGVGSGFFVTDSGHVVTNYHVVSEVVHDPDRYRAELVDASGQSHHVSVLAIDVVHDLAILRGPLQSARYFRVGPAPLRQGDRLYSLGHPSDLGLSIVEGTHNGLLQHTLYPKVHFTGSINPGMSGGPTITARGQVVGVNVSTAGNQLSFLVPVDQVVALLQSTLRPSPKPSGSLLDEVGRQLRQHQDVYLEPLFGDATGTVELGPFRAPTEPAPFFRCWGDATRRREMLYQRADHQCSVDDYIYVGSEQESGIVDLHHELISSSQLGVLRFFALYTSIFQTGPGFSDEEHLTAWKCRTRNVRQTSLPLRAVLCLRRYRKLGELYDAMLKVAVLGRRDTGLTSTLTLSGASFENITRITTRYLERITWR